MKKEKGITLVSLVIYIIAMLIVIVVMSLIIDDFYNNNTQIQEDIEEIVEFNKFNNYFLKEVKTTDNQVDTLSGNYILFASGNSFSKNGASIYYNDIKICDGVKEMKVTLGEDGEDKNKDGIIDENDETIINVTLSFDNFTKSISYKLENIY